MNRVRDSSGGNGLGMRGRLRAAERRNMQAHGVSRGITGTNDEEPRQGRHSDAEHRPWTLCRPAGAIPNPHNFVPTATAVGYRCSALPGLKRAAESVTDPDYPLLRRGSGDHYPRRYPAASLAKYVMIRSAPARLIPVSDSSTTSRSLSQPFFAAALIMLYSPLT